ncbi:hypothetical protein KR067_002413 [Drosophila pandora]|nr:hypothetical protein KR067_002413 [Drosophila pandora]
MEEWYTEGDEASRTQPQHSFRCMSTEAAAMASAAEQSSRASSGSSGPSSTLEREYRDLSIRVKMMKRELARAEEKRNALSKIIDQLEALCRKYPEKSQRGTLVELIATLIESESCD